jgi:hypothetical protein
MIKTTYAYYIAIEIYVLVCIKNFTYLLSMYN